MKARAILRNRLHGLFLDPDGWDRPKRLLFAEAMRVEDLDGILRLHRGEVGIAIHVQVPASRSV